MELLEDETDFFRPGPVQILSGNSRHIFAVQPYLAGSGPIETSDQVDQGGLAGTGGAHHGQPFTGCNLERNVIQCPDDAAIGLGSGRIEAADMAKFDHVILPSEC